MSTTIDQATGNPPVRAAGGPPAPARSAAWAAGPPPTPATVFIAWAVVAVALGFFAPRVETALSGAGWQANGSRVGAGP